MRRVIVFVALAALAVLAAFWLAEHPGRVSIEWLGYQMEPPIGMLVLAGVLLSVAVIILYRIITLILGTPGTIGRALSASRRRRGFRALSQGMVAVAAGDAQEAARWSRKADSLLEDPPLTLLLSAQAAQLNGDELAAEKYFNAMLEKPETRFLGLRGLLMQALRKGDDQRALGYVREAHAMRPKTPWVVTNLFELSERTGDYDGAAAALKQAAKIKALAKPEADHKGAVITLAKAEKALAEGRRDEALSLSRTAQKADAALLAAAVLHARLAVDSERFREAAKVVERIWARSPSAELAALYRKAAPAAKPLEQVKRFTKLAALNPNHRESHLALAEANLDAGLWGEARRHLGILVTLEGEDPARAHVCRLMARLEESEHGDIAAARAWLERAGEAPRDPAWVCTTCGAVAARWSVDCGACGSFDSLAWGAPRRVGSLAVSGAGSALAQITAKQGARSGESRVAPVTMPLAKLPDQPPDRPDGGEPEQTGAVVAKPAAAPPQPAQPQTAPAPTTPAAASAEIGPSDVKPALPKPPAPPAPPAGGLGPNGQEPPASTSRAVERPELGDEDAEEAAAVEGSVPPRIERDPR
ncbi:heme biosynthesis protein HemY [Pelagibius sp.]|uniref:heme biosynthesis protein HemY n=1 Tax=Pelagibius sp. TaxID=1931238 RepID=UPI00261B2B05|nr:heme biosynthesis HemY N-terminal domain-containing protein [Pelagibius sp.]